MLTPFGIYVYNVLAMGLSNATDLFGTCIHEVLQGLNGCANIADDVLVYGTTYDEIKNNVLAFPRSLCTRRYAPQPRQGENRLP